MAGKRPSYELTRSPEILDAAAPIFRDSIQRAFDGEDLYVSVDLVFRPERTRITLKQMRNGEYRLQFRVRFQLTLSGDVEGHFAGAWKWRVRRPKSEEERTAAALATP